MTEDLHRLPCILPEPIASPRLRELPSRAPGRKPRGLGARVEAPVAAEADAGFEIEQASPRRAAPRRARSASGGRPTRARAAATGRRVPRTGPASPAARSGRSGRTPRATSRAMRAAPTPRAPRGPAFEPFRANQRSIGSGVNPASGTPGSVPSKATSVAQQGAMRHGLHPRGERRAGSCERGGRGRRQREDDGGEIGVRGAAIVEERPSAAAALEPHDPARRTRHRGHGRGNAAAHSWRARRPRDRRAVRGPARPDASARPHLPLRQPRALRETRNPSPSGTVRRGRRSQLGEAPRREPSAGRALRLEHAQPDAGFLQALRACNAGKPCADHGDRDGIHASLRFR